MTEPVVHKYALPNRGMRHSCGSPAGLASCAVIDAGSGYAAKKKEKPTSAIRASGRAGD